MNFESLLVAILTVAGFLFVAFSKPFARVSTKNASSYWPKMSNEKLARWFLWHRWGAVAGGIFFLAIGVLFFSGVIGPSR